MAIFDNDKFIHIIEGYPIIWDSCLDAYKDKELKGDAWQDVLEEMFEEATGWDEKKITDIRTELQKKWKNIRNSFSREVAKRKNLKPGLHPTWKTYMYFDQLQFLFTVMNTETDPSLNCLDEESEGNIERSIETTTSNLQRNKVRPSTDTFLPIGKRSRISPNADLEDKPAENLPQNDPHDSENNEERYFLLSLVGDLKRVPPNRKLAVKIEIMKVINEAIPRSPVYIDMPHSLVYSMIPHQPTNINQHHHQPTNINQHHHQPTIISQHHHQPQGRLGTTNYSSAGNCPQRTSTAIQASSITSNLPGVSSPISDDATYEFPN